jgi:hypothetical protein
LVYRTEEDLNYDRSRNLPRTVASWPCSMAAHYGYLPIYSELRIGFADTKSNRITGE